MIFLISFGIILFLFLIPLIRLGIYFSDPKVRGKIGETYVARILNSLPKEYKILNNLIIKNENFSSQIDHIVISKFGIFVIETKNIKGWIYGYDNQKYWTKNVYGIKYKFYNPIKQNKSHCLALKNFLNLKESIFIPIVVFSDFADIKSDFKDIVINMSDLKNYIKSFTTIRLLGTQVNNIFEKLQKYPATQEETIKHISKIYQKKEKEYENIKNNICPKCKGYLIERKGKYGIFLGCSNYPRCHFTLPKKILFSSKS